MMKDILHPDKVVTKGTILPWIDCMNPEEAAGYDLEPANDCLITNGTKILWPDNSLINYKSGGKPPIAE